MGGGGGGGGARGKGVSVPESSVDLTFIDESGF